MRVLLVSHQAPPHIGGVESVVQMEAEALCAAGHDVVWVTSDGVGEGLAPIAHERLRLVRVRAWHGIERRFRIAYPLFAPSLPWRLWREVGRADVVHVHGLVFPGSPLAALFARLRGVPCVCTDHGGVLRYPSRLVAFALRVLFETAGRLTARCAHQLVALNGEIEALLVRLGGDRAKVRLLPNPVDRATFRPPTPAERAAARMVLGWDDRLRVLCVARLLPHKGIDVLLDAQDAAWRVVFCGPGDDDVRARIRDRGGECLAPRSRGELLTLYHAADAFALPSHNEGFPVVVQEALACGLPVLTSDAPTYAPYRGTPGLYLCEPTAIVVRERLREVLAAPRPSAARVGADEPHADRDAWLRTLLAPLPATLPGAPLGEVPRGLLPALLVLLVVVHLVVGVLRVPGKVVGRRLQDIAAYRERGAAEFLIADARLEGAGDLAWLLREAPPDSVVLWRWPSDGAVEFASALLAPRWLVDEREVPADADSYLGRPLARGVLPDGRRGVFVVQGTPAQGLVLRVREP